MSASWLYAAEPASSDPDAQVRKIEDESLKGELLKGRPGEDEALIAIRRVGHLMGRSEDRLARDRDPGTVTRKIQDQIVASIDDLLMMVRRRPAEPSTKPSSGAAPPEPGTPPPANSGGPPRPNRANQPAANSEVTGGSGNASGTDIREPRNDGVMKLSPRLRDPIIEGMQDRIIGKYEEIVRKYYQAIAEKGSERRP
jgi:hypothetical protein